MLPEPGMRSSDALQQPLDLDLFHGPFDLLLTLVLRDEVDLGELPLAELVPAALGERGDERWDAPTSSELVVLLAALAELKARRLLGEPDDEEPDPDAVEARERLAARLVAYAPFQRAAAWLAERGVASSGPRYRRVPLADLAPPPAPREAPDLLAAALVRLLRAAPEPSLAHLTSRRVHLPGLLARLRDRLRSGPVSFESLLGPGGPLEEGMQLVAALEVRRRGEAELTQPVPFGDITITPVK
jgi:segregation and condensation protein A